MSRDWVDAAVYNLVEASGAYGGAGWLTIDRHTRWPGVIPDLVSLGLFDVVAERRGRSGQLMPQVVRLTHAGEQFAREVLLDRFAARARWLIDSSQTPAECWRPCREVRSERVSRWMDRTR